MEPNCDFQVKSCHVLARDRQRLGDSPVARGVGDPTPDFVESYSTVQVKDYSRYAMDGLQPDAHVAWHAAHWEEDLAKACAAGRRMAEKALPGTQTTR